MGRKAHQETFRLSAAAVIRDTRNRTLLVMEDGLWGPPGGHNDNTDLSIIHTAGREVPEETGYRNVEFRVGNPSDDLWLPAPATPIGQFRGNGGRWGFVFEGRVSGHPKKVRAPEIQGRGWFSQRAIREVGKAGMMRRPEVNLWYLLINKTPEEIAHLKRLQRLKRIRIIV